MNGFREFYLENADGVMLSLQSETLFFNRPEGLGFGVSRGYMQGGFGFSIETTRTYEQANIIGELIIQRDFYKQYEEFAAWADVGGITLFYRPQDERVLRMDVDIESVGLSEIGELGVMELPISLRGKSPYYQVREGVYRFELEETENPMKFPFKFPFKFVRTQLKGRVCVRARGHFPAAIELEARGPFIRPVLTAIDCTTDKAIGTVSLPGVSIARGESLLYSTRPNATGVYRVTSGIRKDISNLLDIYNENFFTLPVSVPVKIEFGADVPSYYDKEMEHILNIYEYFRG